MRWELFINILETPSGSLKNKVLPGGNVQQDYRREGMWGGECWMSNIGCRMSDVELFTVFVASFSLMFYCGSCRGRGFPQTNICYLPGMEDVECRMSAIRCLVLFAVILKLALFDLSRVHNGFPNVKP